MNPKIVFTSLKIGGAISVVILGSIYTSDFAVQFAFLKYDF